MVSKSRWKEAQQAEKNFFTSHKGQLRKLLKGWFLGELTRKQGFGFLDIAHFEDKTIVEIGCGAYGFVSVLGGRKIGIDPLITFMYARNLVTQLSQERNESRARNVMRITSHKTTSLSTARC